MIFRIESYKSQSVPELLCDNQIRTEHFKVFVSAEIQTKFFWQINKQSFEISKNRFFYLKVRNRIMTYLFTQQ